MATFRNIEKKITKAGWVLIRINGSHYQYRHTNHPDPITIPDGKDKDLAAFVIENLENQTGLSLRR